MGTIEFNVLQKPEFSVTTQNIDVNAQGSGTPTDPFVAVTAQIVATLVGTPATILWTPNNSNANSTVIVFPNALTTDINGLLPLEGDGADGSYSSVKTYSYKITITNSNGDSIESICNINVHHQEEIQLEVITERQSTIAVGQNAIIRFKDIDGSFTQLPSPTVGLTRKTITVGSAFTTSTEIFKIKRGSINLNVENLTVNDLIPRLYYTINGTDYIEYNLGGGGSPTFFPVIVAGQSNSRSVPVRYIHRKYKIVLTSNLTTFTPIFIEDLTTRFCVLDGNGDNTGFHSCTTLIKVVGDNGPFQGQTLDVNNNLVSQTGLATVTKPNQISDPDYIAPVYDIAICALPQGGGEGGGPTIDCEEFFNNNGVATDTVSYIDCNGVQVNNVTIESNQSVCAQINTMSGAGAGSLMNLGTCGNSM